MVARSSVTPQTWAALSRVEKVAVAKVHVKKRKEKRKKKRRKKKRRMWSRRTLLSCSS